MLSLALVLALVAPSVLPVQSAPVTVQAASTVKLNKTKVTLIKGQSVTLKITGTSKKVTWSTSNKKVATVTSKGKVTAAGKGSATITAKVNGKKYNCKVTVETPAISKTSVSVQRYRTCTLKMSGTSQKVTWSTSNKDVATVNSKGKVTAKKEGTATITAKVLGKKYNCKVKVVTNKVYNNVQKVRKYIDKNGSYDDDYDCKTIEWEENTKNGTREYAMYYDSEDKTINVEYEYETKTYEETTIITIDTATQNRLLTAYFYTTEDEDDEVAAIAANGDNGVKATTYKKGSNSFSDDDIIAVGISVKKVRKYANAANDRVLTSTAGILKKAGLTLADIGLKSF